MLMKSGIVPTIWPRRLSPAYLLMKKANNTAGISLDVEKCSGNISAVPHLGFPGFCIAGSPIRIMGDHVHSF